MTRLARAVERRIQVAWAAGLIDGEGCISINPSDGNVRRWELRVQMGSMDAIDRLARILPGTVTNQVRPPPRGIYWRWRCRDRHLVDVLLELLPHLTVKRELALQVIRETERQHIQRRAA